MDDDSVSWLDVEMEIDYSPWQSNPEPRKPPTWAEIKKWLEEQWEYECTHPPKPMRWIVSRAEYDWWVEYLRMAEEERRIAFASRATQLL